MIQQDLMSYWNDIRKINKEVEVNRKSVDENTSRDMIARGAMWAAGVIWTILMMIWKMRGKIKGLQRTKTTGISFNHKSSSSTATSPSICLYCL